jgi:hypothetical protein
MYSAKSTFHQEILAPHRLKPMSATALAATTLLHPRRPLVRDSDGAAGIEIRPVWDMVIVGIVVALLALWPRSISWR